jgi:hypothetical protein
MNRESGGPQNDKAMFSAVTSLMKAQAYELAALPERKKEPVIYQFNLISVVDADLVRLHFAKDQITEIETESEQYIARYIVRRKETFSRVRFIRANRFAHLLEDYSRLHSANCGWLATLHSSFYQDVMGNTKKIEVLIKEFRETVEWYLQLRIRRVRKESGAIKSLSLDWNAANKQVAVNVGTDTSTIVFLNGDTDSRNHVASALKKIYRYEGPFGFEEDFPF